MTESESGYSGVSNDQAILDDINELSNEELQQKTHEALLVEESFTIILIVGAFRFSTSSLKFGRSFTLRLSVIEFSVFSLSDSVAMKGLAVTSRLTLWDRIFQEYSQIFQAWITKFWRLLKKI